MRYRLVALQVEIKVVDCTAAIAWFFVWVDWKSPKLCRWILVSYQDYFVVVIDAAFIHVEYNFASGITKFTG